MVSDRKFYSAKLTSLHPETLSLKCAVHDYGSQLVSLELVFCQLLSKKSASAIIMFQLRFETALLPSSAIKANLPIACPCPTIKASWYAPYPHRCRRSDSTSRLVYLPPPVPLLRPGYRVLSPPPHPQLVHASAAGTAQHQMMQMGSHQ